MTTTVLVPSDEGRTALAGLDNVRPVGYDPAGPMPEEAADAEVLVVCARPSTSQTPPRYQAIEGAGGAAMGGPLAWPSCVLCGGRRSRTSAVSCCSW